MDRDQIGEVEDVFDAGKGLTRAGRSDRGGQRRSLPWGRANSGDLRRAEVRTSGTSAQPARIPTRPPLPQANAAAAAEFARRTLAIRPPGVQRAIRPEFRLFELDLGARFLELGLDRVGLLLVHALLDRLRGRVDQVLGLLEAEAGA